MGAGRTLRIILLALFVPMLAACGFQPMYAERDSGASTATAWRQVDIAPLKTRTGQLVRNALLAGTAPATEGNGRYELRLEVTEEEQTMAITSRRGTAHKRLILAAGYALHDKRTGRLLTKGRTFADTSYSITRQHFADLASRDHARRTLARILAQDVRTRVSAWLARHETGSAKAGP
jgi:LPS-assembly lipoprotein